MAKASGAVDGHSYRFLINIEAALKSYFCFFRELKIGKHNDKEVAQHYKVHVISVSIVLIGPQRPSRDSGSH